MSEDTKTIRIRLGPVATGLLKGADPHSYSKTLDEQILKLGNPVHEDQALEPRNSAISEIRALLAQGFQEAERHHRGIIQMLILLSAGNPDEIQRGLERVESRVNLIEPQLEGGDVGDYFDRLTARFQHFHETQIEPERDQGAGRER